MYLYRKLTPEQRAELVAERLARGFQPHAPPHHLPNESRYLLTAACYEHAPHMLASERRDQLMEALTEQFDSKDIALQAWVVLPNHYHLLAEVPDLAEVGRTLQMVHGRLAHRWNKADAAPGRKVWFRFADRAIRSKRHYYVALNYIHYNPVKHGRARSPYEWSH